MFDTRLSMTERGKLIVWKRILPNATYFFLIISSSNWPRYMAEESKAYFNFHEIILFHAYHAYHAVIRFLSAMNGILKQFSDRDVVGLHP